MWTLGSDNNFYKSKEWKSLVEILKIKRANSKDGILYCEHCGKPILKKYDCIGHHKEELTEENVNDINISLNEDNIMLIHFNCHNDIHNRFGYSRKQVYLVYGPPFSGKHDYVDSIRNKTDIVCSYDLIYEAIGSGSRYYKDNSIKSVAFDLRDYLLELIKIRKGKWSNAYIIATIPSKGERERLLNKLNAREVLINTSEDDCINNCINHFDNNKNKINEYKEFISEWFEDFQE